MCVGSERQPSSFQSYDMSQYLSFWPQHRPCRYSMPQCSLARKWQLPGSFHHSCWTDKPWMRLKKCELPINFHGIQLHDQGNLHLHSWIKFSGNLLLDTCNGAAWFGPSRDLPVRLKTIPSVSGISLNAITTRPFKNSSGSFFISLQKSRNEV